MTIGRTILTSLSAVGRGNQSTASFFKGGIVGTIAAGGYAVNAAQGYYTYGRDYGSGGGVLMGLGENAAYDLAIKAGVGGIAIAGIAAAGYFTYQKGRDIYKANRRFNMIKPMNDTYGTINQMRMHSVQNLSRNRAASSRVLGNEAQMLHR